MGDFKKLLEASMKDMTFDEKTAFLKGISIGMKQATDIHDEVYREPVLNKP